MHDNTHINVLLDTYIIVIKRTLIYTVLLITLVDIISKACNSVKQFDKEIIPFQKSIMNGMLKLEVVPIVL